VGDLLGRALQQVREAHKELTLAQANRGVQRGKPPKADRDGRHWRSGTQRPVLFLKDRNNISGHSIQITACGERGTDYRDQGSEIDQARSRRMKQADTLAFLLFDFPRADLSLRLCPLLAALVLVEVEIIGLLGQQVPGLFSQILSALDGLLAGQLEGRFCGQRAQDFKPAPGALV